MTEPPYPVEPQITYTIRELFDQINVKLDLLPGLAGQISAQEARSVEDRAAIKILDARLGVLEQLADTVSTTSMLKDRAWGKILGIATLVGGVAGTMSVLVRMVAG